MNNTKSIDEKTSCHTKKQTQKNRIPMTAKNRSMIEEGLALAKRGCIRDGGDFTKFIKNGIK